MLRFRAKVSGFPVLRKIQTGSGAQTASYIITTGVPKRSRLEEFGSSQFPDENDRDGPSNVRFIAIQQLDAAGSPRIFD
jgi:hypothetical protein